MLRSIFGTLIISTQFISLSVQAKRIDIQEMCSELHKNITHSKIATQNQGFYQKTQRSSGRNRIITTKMHSYKGCRYDTPWIKQTYKLLCNGPKARSTKHTYHELNQIKIPQNLLFFFEGAGDFNAKKAKQALADIVNIDGSEGKDLNLGYGLGLSLLKGLVSTDFYPVNDHRESLEIHYHSSSGTKLREGYSSAIKCAEQSNFYISKLKEIGHVNSTPQWSVIGFSNGGELTIDFQNDLAQKDISVGLAITIDPIVQMIKYPFHHLKKTIGVRNSKTQRFVNIYQQSDFGSIPYFELQGKPVVDADLNILMDPNNYIDLNTSGKKNHIQIVKSAYTLDVVSCEFMKFLDNSFTCGYSYYVAE